MFTRSAHLYDLIYRFKDYAGEADRLAALLAREHPAARSILDAACGTAEHARLLEDRFDVDGIEIEPTFVEIARRKLARGSVHLGDISDFDLGRRYDAVLCLFGSIGYLRESTRLVAALACFRRHLDPGGLILLEPWFTPERWRVDALHMQTAEDDDVKVCRMCISEVESGSAKLRFHYLVGTAGGVEHFTEDHLLRLRTVEEMLAAFREAGLTAEHDPEGINGRGLYLARAAT